MVTVPGHIKYLIANPEVWKSFRGAHGVPAAPPSVDGCGMKNVEMKYGEIQCCQNFLEISVPWSRMDLRYLAQRLYLFQIAGGIPVRERIRRNRRNASVHS